MSLRCKACDKLLDTKDPDYCKKCLSIIYYYDKGDHILDELIESEREIIDETLKYFR